MKKQSYYGRCELTGKVRYPTNGSANMAKSYLVRTGKATSDLVSKYCDSCRGFHVGNPNAKAIQ